jgi:hypothetical protein
VRNDTAPEPLVLDACILISLCLRQLFFRAADQGLCHLHWSERILDESAHNLVRMGHLDAEGAAFFLAAIHATFPLARVEVPDSVIADMRNATGDRHVTGAAVVASARIIVTVNLRDFPPPALAPWGIEGHHPDRVLLRLLARSPHGMMTVVRAMAEDAPAGYAPGDATLYALRRVAPRFARKIKEAGILTAQGPLTSL